MDRTNRRVLWLTFGCYLDDSNGAAVASRALVGALAREGFAIEVICGGMFDHDREIDLADWLTARGTAFEVVDDSAWLLDGRGVRPDVPRHLRLWNAGVPVSLVPGGTTRLHDPDDNEHRSVLRLFNNAIEAFRPDVLAMYGGDRIVLDALAEARRSGTSPRVAWTSDATAMSPSCPTRPTPAGSGA